MSLSFGAGAVGVDRLATLGAAGDGGDGFDGDGFDGDGLDGDGLDGEGLDGEGLDGDGFDGDVVDPLGAAHTSALLHNMFTAAPIPSATASPASRPGRAAMLIDSPSVPTML